MPVALIFGVTGQDGSLLARHLLGKGYQVIGTCRDAANAKDGNLRRLGLVERLTLASVATHDFRSVIQLLMQFKPDEVYHLSGQSSVALSFEQPVETMESILHTTITVLEAIRMLGHPVRYYSAGSSECFGNISEPATELSPFSPRSPYAVAKSAAFWQVANYREAYNIYACTGILFNHESPLRPGRFVTQKIISAVKRIRDGSTEKLNLGNVDVQRDWGWSAEYVDAMWRMLQLPHPQDLIIATGKTYRLFDFITETFSACKLNWEDHVVTNPALLRPTEIMVSRADPSKAAAVLGWRATRTMPDVIRGMLDEDL